VGNFEALGDAQVSLRRELETPVFNLCFFVFPDVPSVDVRILFDVEP